jgi:predicted GNAT family acetyltransferase
MELGRYFGMYMPDKNGDVRLAAMIGERLGTDTHTEMSAICTHPDFNGRGYARRLTAFLTNDTLARGRTPFLHVSHENVRALRLYENMGYALRRDIGFWALRRAA